VGGMRVTQQMLHTDSGSYLVVATAEAGSPSQAAMTLLAHSTTAGQSRAPSGRVVEFD